MTIVRIDCRRFKDEAGLHDVLAEAFGFPDHYGRNRDALIDCLSSLDDFANGGTRLQVLPGGIVSVVLDHLGELKKPQRELAAMLMESVAFVNWRRLERGRPPILALAYDNS